MTRRSTRVRSGQKRATGKRGYRDQFSSYLTLPSASSMRAMIADKKTEPTVPTGMADVPAPGFDPGGFDPASGLDPDSWNGMKAYGQNEAESSTGEVDWATLGYGDDAIGNEWGPKGYDETGFAIDAGGWGHPGFAPAPSKDAVTADLASMGLATAETGNESVAGLQAPDFEGLDQGIAPSGMIAGLTATDFEGLGDLSPSGDVAGGLSGYPSEAGFDPGAGLGVSVDSAPSDGPSMSGISNAVNMGLDLITGGPFAVAGDMLSKGVSDDMGLYSPTSLAGKAGAKASNVASTALATAFLGPMGTVLGPTIGKALTHAISDVTNSRDQEGWHDYEEDYNKEGLKAGILAGNQMAKSAANAETISSDIDSVATAAPAAEHAVAFDAFKGNQYENDYSMFDVGGFSNDLGSAGDFMGGQLGIEGLGAGFDGGGGGGGGGKVLCTELNRQGFLPDHILAADLECAKNISAEVKEGYWLWAKPLVEVMKRSELVTAMLRPFITAWAYQMAYKMGVVTKPNRLGVVLEKIGIPICRWLSGKASYPVAGEIAQGHVV